MARIRIRIRASTRSQLPSLCFVQTQRRSSTNNDSYSSITTTNNNINSISKSSSSKSNNTGIHHSKAHIGLVTAPRFKAPIHPVVLCHGLFGFDVIGPESVPFLQLRYWRGIHDALVDIGCKVHTTRVGSVSAIKTRAAQLNAQCSQHLAGQTLNFVAHSMGGLDCRHLISTLRPTAFKVGSLTTVATPHRGSPFMDWCRDAFGVGTLQQYINSHRDDAAAAALLSPDSSFGSSLEQQSSPRPNVTPSPSLLKPFQANRLLKAICAPLDAPAFTNLTTEYTRGFNLVTPDSPEVAYYSYAAVCEVSRLAPLYFSYQIVKRVEGPNDGLVGIESAKWGTFMGTVECDHWELLPPKVRRLPGTVGAAAKRFDSVGFYLDIVTGLADRGF